MSYLFFLRGRLHLFKYGFGWLGRNLRLWLCVNRLLYVRRFGVFESTVEEFIYQILVVAFLFGARVINKSVGILLGILWLAALFIVVARDEL